MLGLFCFFTSTDECYHGKLLWCCSNVFLFFFSELWQQNRSLVFQGHGVALQAQTMLLDEGHERLYIGAKNSLFSLSLDQINTDQAEVGLFPAVRKYVVNSLILSVSQHRDNCGFSRTDPVGQHRISDRGVSDEGQREGKDPTDVPGRMTR